VSSFLKVTGGRFERIVAFEPDPLNCAKLRNGVAALPGELAERIEIRQQATGRSNSLVSFAVTGGEGSAMGTGDFCVECVKLDSALDGVVPTIIKLDIEGAEIEAIEGAREVIGRSMPVLAVCSYHRQSDLWRIPCLIHSICPDYRLYLRPHRMEGWDSVCYAVPPHRRPA
jgi:FkbM family methyltransferase